MATADRGAADPAGERTADPGGVLAGTVAGRDVSDEELSPDAGELGACRYPATAWASASAVGAGLTVGGWREPARANPGRSRLDRRCPVARLCVLEMGLCAVTPAVGH